MGNIEEDCILGLDIQAIWGAVMDLMAGILRVDYGVVMLPEVDILTVHTWEAELLVGVQGKHPITDRAGKLHANADTLSCMPSHSVNC